MVRRIIAFLMLPSLIIALYLCLGGVRSIPFDSPYMYTYFKVVAHRFDSFTLQIPRIPKVPYLDYYDGSGVWIIVLNVLIFMVRMLTFLINGLSGIINAVGAVLNFFIAFLEYALIFIYSLRDLRNGLISAGA